MEANETVFLLNQEENQANNPEVAERGSKVRFDTKRAGARLLSRRTLWNGLLVARLLIAGLLILWRLLILLIGIVSHLLAPLTNLIECSLFGELLPP